LLELVSAEAQELGGALRLLDGDARLGQRLEVMAAGRLGHGNPELMAPQASAVLVLGQLANDLQPHRIRERLQNGKDVDRGEIGALRDCFDVAHLFDGDRTSMYDRRRTIPDQTDLAKKQRSRREWSHLAIDCLRGRRRAPEPPCSCCAAPSSSTRSTSR